MASRQAGSLQALPPSKKYVKLQSRHLAGRQLLWEDKDFPANTSSLGKEVDKVIWKRPREICSCPQFDKCASTVDVNQGSLGNCWFVAAMANLTTSEKLFQIVVPTGQSFLDGKYTGIFRFNLWNNGHCEEVIVDDRLPCTTINTPSGPQFKLLYTSSDRGEFWASLLEKAYAKIHGSYAALEGGYMAWAFESFTGQPASKWGLQDLRRDQSKQTDLFNKLWTACRADALIGAGLLLEKTETEQMGLFSGHAYSVLQVELVETKKQPNKVPLLRIFNPWGDEHEWNGAWGDRSPEWGYVSAAEKKRINYTNCEDGEFWMPLDFFVQQFDIVEICRLNREYLDDKEAEFRNGKWISKPFEGRWKRSAGAQLFGANSRPADSSGSGIIESQQYPFKISGLTKQKVFVSLQQQNRKKDGNLAIAYAIYPQKKEYPLYKSEFVEVSGHFGRHVLSPGKYVIVPMTRNSTEEGDFTLTLYTNK